jgi:putative SOS response-associated peptidase YedK
MPAILTPENEVRWLSRDVFDTGQIKDILAPYPSGEMKIVPVSPLINNPTIDDERVITPVNSFSHM